MEMQTEKRNRSNHQELELPTRLKYRLTLDKLESLVRHLERNEAELEHLEGALIARSEHWLYKLNSSLQLFSSEWADELAQRTVECTHQCKDGTVL